MKVTIISNVLNVYLKLVLFMDQAEYRIFNEHLSILSFLSYLWGWANFPALGVKGAAIGLSFLLSGWLLIMQ